MYAPRGKRENRPEDAEHASVADAYSICYCVDVKEVVFVESAFRHGYAEEDFYGLLSGRYLKIRSQRGTDSVYELLGRSVGGAYLHVVYRVLPDGRLRVFHISRMTDKQRRRYQRLQR